MWLALLVFLLATPAAAEKWDFGCTNQGTATTATTQDLGGHNVDDVDIACFTFMESDTAAENSPEFHVTGIAARVCLDDNVGNATGGAGAAQVDLRACEHGDMPAANPDQQCSVRQVQAGPLDGTQGPPATQNECVRVGPGVYYIDIVTAPGAGEVARVTIKGEDTN